MVIEPPTAAVDRTAAVAAAVGAVMEAAAVANYLQWPLEDASMKFDLTGDELQ